MSGLKSSDGPAQGSAGESESPGLAGIVGEQERSGVSDAAIYTSATYAAQTLMFLATLVQRGLLGPTNTGYWTLMATAWSFFGIASLGVVDGALRQIPHYRGRGELPAAADTANSAFSFSQIVTSAVGVVLIVVALVAGSGWAPELRWGLVLVGLIAPLRNLVDVHEMVFQATKRFVPFSAGLIVKAFVTITVQTLAVYFFGFYGMFFGLVTLNVAVLALWRRMRVSGPKAPAFRRSIQRERLVELIKVGIPLYVYSHAWILFLAIDSLIVAGFVGVRELGYYALAGAITSWIILLPLTIGQTVFPRMQERYSASGDMGAARQYASNTQLIMAFMLVPVFIAAAYFLLPVLIRHALPAFEPAIPVVHIMAAGSFLIALVDMPIQLIVTIGRRWNLSVLMVGGLVLNAVANYVAVAVLDGGIKGAAYATVISYLVLLVAVSSFGFLVTGGWRLALRQLGAIAAVFVWTVGSMWGLEALAGSGAGSLPADVAVNLGKFAAFCLLLAPWLFFVERRYQALSALREPLESFHRTARDLLRFRATRSGDGRN